MHQSIPEASYVMAPRPINEILYHTTIHYHRQEDHYHYHSHNHFHTCHRCHIIIINRSCNSPAFPRRTHDFSNGQMPQLFLQSELHHTDLWSSAQRSHHRHRHQTGRRSRRVFAKRELHQTQIGDGGAVSRTHVVQCLVQRAVSGTHFNSIIHHRWAPAKDLCQSFFLSRFFECSVSLSNTVSV